MYRDFKIFGERNTSTNVLRQAIEANSASRILEIGADQPSKIDEFVFKRPRLKPPREAWLDRRYRNVSPLYGWKHAAPLRGARLPPRSAFVAVTSPPTPPQPSASAPWRSCHR